MVLYTGCFLAYRRLSVLCRIILSFDFGRTLRTGSFTFFCCGGHFIQSMADLVPADAFGTGLSGISSCPGVGYAVRE